MAMYLILSLRPGTAEVGREEEGVALGCPSKRAVLRLCGTKPVCFPIEQRNLSVKRSYTYQVAKVCLVEVEARSVRAEPTPGSKFTDPKEYCPVPHSAHHAPSPKAKSIWAVCKCVYVHNAGSVFCVTLPEHHPGIHKHRSPLP